ncbi:hypothetical protein BXZ70DRAFT_191887 [Cristinia sonorae]|uniref:Uncharacterized protein n=1 Tax=Cristinia sonorae TaxID=1940300 RepID=A0A8K0UP86_9AGAR|nr:hypothetical protein BXZ70DRAFT_191887 [Cristinia sonorae]
MLKCSLVCRSWLPRSRYHTALRAKIRSFAQLTSMRQFIRSSKHDLSSRYVSLTLEPDGDGAWLTNAPQSLAGNFNIISLTFRKVDFTRQHVQFYRHWSLLRVDELHIQKPLCTRWPQLTRLVSYIRAHRWSCEDVGEGISGEFFLQSQSLREFGLRGITGDGLAFLTWRLSAPLLREIDLRTPSVVEEVPLLRSRLCTAAVGLFTYPHHNLPVLEKVSAFQSIVFERDL